MSLNTYLRIFYHSFPCKRFSNKHNTNPWISCGIIVSSQHKCDLYILCRATKDTKLMKYYKIYTKISDVIKVAKHKYYSQLLRKANNKSKTAWNIINSVINKKTINHDISLIDADGKICTDYQNIANVFNKYFTSLPHATSIINSASTPITQHNASPLDYLKSSCTKPFSKINLQPVTFKEIAICRSLKPTNSHGYDSISSKVLKISLPFIISPLTYMCNLSLQKGIFPTR
jgi:hypothetical protein